MSGGGTGGGLKLTTEAPRACLTNISFKEKGENRQRRGGGGRHIRKESKGASGGRFGLELLVRLVSPPRFLFLRRSSKKSVVLVKLPPRVASGS